MSSMSHKSGTDTIDGSSALESKESPTSINLGAVGGRTAAFA